MQLSLLSGVIAGKQAEFRASPPTNLEPVVLGTGISKGQFRAAAGVAPFTAGPGIDRGGITWNAAHYRVMGARLVSVKQDGAVTVIGDVGDDGRPARLDYGFDRLMIASAGKLYYYDGITLSQVTDPDLGAVVDALWFNGFHVFTDGTYVGVTELSDPMSVLPLKYGSAEQDPDMVTGLMRIRGELYVLGGVTIEVHELVGGSGFPFRAITGATIPYGCCGRRAKAYFAESFGFVGRARGASLGVYVAGSGTAQKISTRRIDDELAKVEDETAIVVEARSYRDEERLLVHLPDATWVYMLNASRQAGELVWYRAQSGRGEPYRARNAALGLGGIVVGDADSNQIGFLSEDVSDHFGEIAEWSFDVGLLYNGGKGGIVYEIELSGLPGRAPEGDETTVFLSFTNDGETFSDEHPKSLGRAGERARKVRWRPGRRFRNWLGLRFRGHGRAMPGFAACEAEIEGLRA